MSSLFAMVLGLAVWLNRLVGPVRRIDSKARGCSNEFGAMIFSKGALYSIISIKKKRITNLWKFWHKPLQKMTC